MQAAVTDKPKLRFILCLGSVTALGPLSIDMYLPALPHLSNDFAASPSMIQTSLSACILGLAFGQLLVGPISDAVGRRGPLLVGLAAYALVSLLCAFAPTAPFLVGARFAQGLAGSAALVIASAIARDLYQGAAAARFFSTLMLVMGLAPILAPILGAQALRLTSWHGIFVILSAAGIALMTAVALLLPETLPPERRHGGGFRSALHSFAAVMRDAPFVTNAAIAGLSFATMFCYIAGAPFVLQKVYGISAQGFAMTFGANAMGLIALSQVNGRLVRHYTPQRLMGWGLALQALGGGVLVTAALGGLGLTAIMAGLFMTVSAQGFIGPNSTALALTNHGRAAGAASALLGALRFIVGAAFAPLVGIAGEQTAVPMACMMLLCATAALLVYWLARRRPC